VTTALNAIPTKYNGYMFRSRLEARWAVFFDVMNIQYEYEAEGYKLAGAGWYLPDFWLPDADVHVEIRPLNKYKYDEKCDALALASSRPVLYIAGSPGFLAYKLNIYPDCFPDTLFPPIQFAECRRCSGIWVSNGCQVAHSLYCDPGCTAGEAIRWPELSVDRIVDAYMKARQERFETE